MLPAIQTPEFAAMLHDQVEKRRTFAIISHPDAGKTTLTEKLLLYGGAIRSGRQREGTQKPTSTPPRTGWTSRSSAASP